MRNVNGIDFNKNSVNTYSANGGIKSVTSGNFEFSIDTLGSSVHTTEVRAAGYQYKLTLKAGASVTNAIGGDTQTANGTAEENTLKVEAGTATNAYGAMTKHGKAYKNHAIAAGGIVTNLVGAKSTNGAAEKNDALISGGSVTNAYGAETLVGDAAENSAVITAGSVTGSLKGAQSAGKALRNTVEIKGAPSAVPRSWGRRLSAMPRRMSSPSPIPLHRTPQPKSLADVPRAATPSRTS